MYKIVCKRKFIRENGRWRQDGERENKQKDGKNEEKKIFVFALKKK